MNLSLNTRLSLPTVRQQFAHKFEAPSGQLEERCPTVPTDLSSGETHPLRRIIALAFVSIACFLSPLGGHQLARGQSDSYTYTSFDAPSSAGTYAGGIADNGTIAGNFVPSDLTSPLAGYSLFGGSFSPPIRLLNNPTTFARITNDGHILGNSPAEYPFLLFAGNYQRVGDNGAFGSSSTTYGSSIVQNGIYSYTYTYTPYAINTADGINNNQLIVGTQGLANSTQNRAVFHPYSGGPSTTTDSFPPGTQVSVARYGYPGQTTYTFQYPGSPITTALGVNDWSVIVGNYMATSTYMYGYILIPGQNAVSVPPPSGYSFGTGTTICDQYPPQFTFPPRGGFNGINNAGRVVGSCVDGSNVLRSFSMFNDHFVIFTPPGAIASYATSINNNNVVVGTWYDLKGVPHGYIAVPANSTTSAMKISPKVKTKPLIGKSFLDIVPALPAKPVSVQTAPAR